MLKIRDEVDLKKLEKFGFAYVTDYRNITILYDKFHDLAIKNKIITLGDNQDCVDFENIMETIYYLTKFGLIEMVENENE